ncbi:MULTISPECIES: AI-2E family transporter [unclassified Methylophaga]|jgi:predicted PurR-regulated permease PerM|uniref:AI-2E family transporter n=1 Tax=unclassified Methylophaga TaxID=2629249 RepID=UPI000C52EC60|nr:MULTISPECIES: AI-2E family transporter [unclassified Methylophaga]MAL49942.1 AI-2E family transporter [Methylophaga sp.]MAM28685.1 AI-2E family transporter [Flavobacteriaceae bacterium]MBP24818.1 AI-2E family transporter [Methylophaga sp.]HCC80940.1 AI-2E family transporter [Methylophaga sp.]|tara:strand:- start:9897 stop:11069 length:1173 start_codon:yes stop_codon:yes gene_type:complete
MSEDIQNNHTKPDASPVLVPNDTPTSALSKANSHWAVIGIFLLLLLASIAYARSFLVPVALGVLLALVFSPVRRFLERRKLPPVVSALIIVGGLITLIGLGVSSLADPVQSWIKEAPTIGSKLEQKLRGANESAKAVIDAGKQIDQLASVENDGEQVQKVSAREPGVLVKLATSVPEILAQMLFTLVLLFFLLASGDMFYEKLVHIMPTFKDKRNAIRISYDIERKLSNYLFAITLINAVLGIAIGVSMWLLGMPNPILFGVLAFAFNFVPYLGAIVGVAIAALVGLLTFDHTGAALLPALAYLTLTIIEGQFATPYFVGRRLEMNPVVIFLSVALWAWLWSIVGMLVAVPLLVAVRTFCEHIPRLQAFGTFLSARGSENVNSENADTET